MFLVLFQAMINIMATFGLSILTFFEFYQYQFQQNEHLRDNFYGMLEWFTILLAFALIVIHMANLVAKEVSICVLRLSTKFSITKNPKL